MIGGGTEMLGDASKTGGGGTEMLGDARMTGGGGTEMLGDGRMTAAEGNLISGTINGGAISRGCGGGPRSTIARGCGGVPRSPEEADVSCTIVGGCGNPPDGNPPSNTKSTPAIPRSIAIFGYLGKKLDGAGCPSSSSGYATIVIRSASASSSSVYSIPRCSAGSVARHALKVTPPVSG